MLRRWARRLRTVKGTVFAGREDELATLERHWRAARRGEGRLVLVEGDLWPLVLREAVRRQVPVVVVNGRVGQRSFRRMRRLRALLGPLLGPVKRFAVQGAGDRQRLEELGVEPERIVETGNLKFDLEGAPPTEAERREKLRALGFSSDRPVLVAGSTGPGEDRLVLEAFGELRDHPRRPILVLAPRHPERFDRVAGEESALLATARFGAYEILGEVARGAMGVVYRARKEGETRPVALKILISGAEADEAQRARFEREARVAAGLKHAGIVAIHEAGEIEGYPFLSMELVDGLPLADYARRNNLGTRSRLELVAHICDAVQHAHDRGIVHRDLKPGNVLVDSGGQPKVLDFGIARATGGDWQTLTVGTASQHLMGTVPYMSPEQIGGMTTWTAAPTSTPWASFSSNC